MKTVLGLIAVLAALLSPASFSDIPKQPPRMRALLISCDSFVTQEDTWPAAENSVYQMADMLMADHRGYELIRPVCGRIASAEELENAIRSVFRQATEEDTSLLYFSTHGTLLEREGEITAGLYFSDGERECVVEAPALEAMLARIPGRIVLIFDACNSGGMIGKGMAEKESRVCFSGPKFRVLCSAGGREASWYWQGKGEEATGTSYFVQALTAGLGPEGGYAADVNRDGQITLGEASRYLNENCAVSTPRAYPEQDDAFVLFSYDADALVTPFRAVTDLTFDDTLLTAGECEVRFSFTVQRQAELYYQIVYYRNGAWQFDQIQQFLDGEQADGTVLPGRKTRSLLLRTEAGDESGYAMIQLITRENGKTVYQGARLLCVQPDQGEIRLSVRTDAAFDPSSGGEMPILVLHDVPCGLTVRIEDSRGKALRYLAYEAPSRPEQLEPAASAFYWDGRLSDGQIAQDGMYRAAVTVRIGGKKWEEKSAPFELMTVEP